MFKGRLGMWISALIAFSLIQGMIAFAPTWFESKDLTVSVSVAVDGDLDEPISSQKINGYKLRHQNDNAGVIIADEEVEMAGYTKYDKYLQSPLVLYAPNLYYYDDSFIRVHPNSTSCHKIDLMAILEAIENGAEWESLGVNSKVANGTVTLYIPNDRCAYYDDIVELFYITLNNGKVPVEEERNTLTERVDAILSKCHMVPDIKQAILDEYNNHTKEHKVFIAPEYLYQRSGTATGTNANQFMPVYFFDTVYLTADVYVKNEDSENASIGEEFVNVIREKSNFMYYTGWRVKNHVFNLDSLSNVYLNTP